MATATYHVGDVFDVMATLADESVDLVLTSPPFLALRSYLPDDHPDKAREIGGEPTPAEFLDTLLALTAEWDRILRRAVLAGCVMASFTVEDFSLHRLMRLQNAELVERQHGLMKMLSV